MKIFFEYGRRALALPSIPSKLLLRAGKTELKLLLVLAERAEVTENYEAHADALAAELKVTRLALDSALGFWLGAGVLSKDKTNSPTEELSDKGYEAEVSTVSAPPKRTRVTELPQYTSDEFARVLERRSELSGLIEEAQGVLGKVFNMTETQCLVSISEGLGLDEEYILSLLAYCKQIGKSNMRYVEKTAISLYDKGIQSAVQLEEHFRQLESLASAEGKIRKIFGMGERAFTSKENEFVNAWIGKYGFDMDIITLAYEETVNNTSKPSMSYANKVLESWYAEGLKTPADVSAAKEKRKGASPSTATQAASFNVDDFFTAALNRGFDTDKKGD